MRYTPCHLDPDIFEKALPRKVGWRACFGQLGAAQCHLSNMGVGVGDIFLYFGWFRKTLMAKKIVFDRTAQDQHIIFGYLQVGEIIHQQDNVEIPDWMSSHPHFAYDDPTNTIYVAREKLSWNENCPTMGNIYEQPIEKIWNNGMYQDMRKRLDSDSPYECCKHCAMQSFKVIDAKSFILC
jgi:hypothetical protein